MKMLGIVAVCLFLAVSLAACVTTPPKERGRIHCPACGTEFDALIEKRF